MIDQAGAVTLLRILYKYLDGMDTRIEASRVALVALGFELSEDDSCVQSTSSKVTDAGLALLANLPSLTSLAVPKTHVTDAGLVHLANLLNLEFLNFFRTGVTDAGLIHLANLTSLTYLDI